VSPNFRLPAIRFPESRPRKSRIEISTLARKAEQQQQANENSQASISQQCSFLKSFVFLVKMRATIEFEECLKDSPRFRWI